MLVTLLGILIEVRPEQYWKAYSPMLVTPLGIVTDELFPKYFRTIPSRTQTPSTVRSSHIVKPLLFKSILLSFFIFFVDT